MKLLQYILFLFLFSQSGYAQYFEVSEYELDTVYLQNELNKLSADRTVEDYVLKVEKTKYISEKLKFHKGVRSANEMLLNYYSLKQNYDAQLRTLLQFLNYVKLNKLSTDELNTLEKIGDIYLRFRLFEKAAESYEKAYELGKRINQHSNNYTLLKKKGVAYKENNQLSQAKKDLTSFSELAKNKQIVLDYIWSLQKLSEIAKSEKKYEEMLRLNQLILDNVNSAKLIKEKVIAVNNLGYAYKYAGKYSEANAEFTKIISDNNNNTVKAVAYQNLGILAQNKEKFETAQSHFKKAAEYFKMDMNYADQGTNLDFVSLTYYQSGDFYNALEYNKQCLQIANANNLQDLKQAAYYTRSLIHQGLYEFEDALEYYKKYLDIKDNLEKENFKKQQGLLQQQYFLERQEGELQMNYISEEIKNLEIAKLKAEAQALIDRAHAEANRLKAYQADSLLKQEQIISQMLRIREIENMLLLKEEQERVRTRENEIALLDEQNKKKALELDNERLQRENDQRIAEMKLEKEAAFNRTLSYILLGLFLMLIVIFIAYRQVRKSKRQIAAQNVIIEDEKDKSENLLLNILPVQVVKELKDKGQTTPRYYKDASVVFTDFAGFTKISELLTPEELVHTLDKVFLEFDLIVEKYGMSRIKTIGDAYMCVSGLPNENPLHAENAVNAAIEMRDFIKSFNLQLPKESPVWNIRIGVNSGSLIAGVVGIRKFAYDIWGDAVNIASRMESSGEISKVNISETTHKLVEKKFQTHYRGKIKAKNKGEIDMYFVERKVTHPEKIASV